MAMTMTMAMTKQQRSKLNWEGMSKWCCLSSHSDGTHHRPVLVPKWRLEGMSKPSAGIQNDRPAHSVFRPAYSPPAYSPPPPPPPPPPPTPPAYVSDELKFVDMGWLRPLSLPLEFYQSRPMCSQEVYDNMCVPIYIPSSGIHQVDHRPDGTPPAPRWWEVKFKKPWRLPSGISDEDRPAPPQLSNVGSISNWKGRLKQWKLGRRFRRKYSAVDVVVNRVYGIVQYFKVPEDPDDLGVHSFEPEQFEYWLDEVEGYFEFMDLAHELHSIDCLFPLLHHVLVYPHAACIREKTAQLVTTMVHNNPRSQQLVMELHGLQPLWYNFTSDPDAISRTKALGAISALIRNNKPGITAFRETNGYAALGDALSSENVWFQREALNLIQYLLHENSSDCNTVTELGLPRIMMHLASSDDAEVRVAALRGLLVLAEMKKVLTKK